MTTTTPTHAEQPPGLRRTAVAGSAGMFIEFYEYGIYGSFAPAISATFFPQSEAGTGLLLTYGIFAVTFLFRPLGGVVLGVLGDRLGRRTALLLSIGIITVATTMIGILPGYHVLGIAAPILLLVLRLAQGFSAGGEVSAAVTLVGEHAPPAKRAFYISFVQAASFSALLIGTLLGVILTRALGEDAVQSWAWRIPFLVALPLGVVGIWIRRKVAEPPAFEKLRENDEIAASPLKDAFRTRDNRRRMLMAAALPMLNSVGYYVLFNYLPVQAVEIQLRRELHDHLRRPGGADRIDPVRSAARRPVRTANPSHRLRDRHGRGCLPRLPCDAAGKLRARCARHHRARRALRRKHRGHPHRAHGTVPSVHPDHVLLHRLQHRAGGLRRRRSADRDRVDRPHRRPRHPGVLRDPFRGGNGALHDLPRRDAQSRCQPG
jgi:Major Facilitator Superfamily